MSVPIAWSVENYVSLAGVVLGFMCSAYLLYDWLKHKRTQPHVFLWAISLVLFYVFLIPFIPAHFGEGIVLSEWQEFFSFTVPLIFLGWVFVYWGIEQARSGVQSLTPPIFLVVWVVTSFIFYAFRFAPTPYEKTLSIIGIVVFFLAIHILTLIALWRWAQAERGRDHKLLQSKTGIAVIAVAIIISIARYLIILAGLIKLPQGLWVLTIANLDLGFILRSVVVVLLAIGFVLVHQMRCNSRNQIA